MLPYFLVTVPIALMAVMMPMYRRGPLLWGLAFVVIVVFVGLRHHVGMDWNNYLFMIHRANSGSLWQSFIFTEPGYAILLRVAGQNGWGVYGAYLMGTVIFAAGLFRYARSTPSPWIALLVAMPFLVVVISMSAARQAVTIGVLLWLAAEWSRSSAGKRVAFILVAASFHISAIGFIVFAFIDLRVPLWVKAIGSVLMVGLMAYVLEASGRAEYYNDLYGAGQSDLTHSSGAIFHVLLNAGPAAMSFLLGRRAREILLPDPFHRQMAILAIILIPVALLASTAASRISLYLFPVSMWFFAALPLLFRDSGMRMVSKVFFAFFFTGLLGFWLSAGNTALAYTNYRNVLFIPSQDLVLCCR